MQWASLARASCGSPASSDCRQREVLQLAISTCETTASRVMTIQARVAACTAMCPLLALGQSAAWGDPQAAQALIDDLELPAVGGQLSRTATAPAEGTVALWAVVATIPVGPGPRYVAITPDGTTAVVTSFESAAVDIVDVRANAVAATVRVGLGPAGVALTPDGATAVVANYDSGTVSVLDMATHAVTRTVSVGQAPSTVAITPDGTTALVCHFVSPGVVSVLDLGTTSVVAAVPVGDFPTGMAITPDGTAALVISETDGLDVLDIETRSLAASAQINASIVAVMPDGTAALVGHWAPPGVSLLDLPTGTVTADIAVPRRTGPWAIAITPDGTTAFVTGGPSVSVLDIATHTEIGTTPVGDGAWGVAVTSDGTKALVVNRGSDTVSVLTRNQREGPAPIAVGRHAL